MKANESVKNYAASVRMYTNYTVREIKKMCKEIGPRPAGSESEKKAQEYVVEQMKTCADEVTMEPFKLAPDAFMAWVRMDGIMIIIAVLFAMLKIPVVSLVLAAVALAFCIGEFLLYKEFIDGIVKAHSEIYEVADGTLPVTDMVISANRDYIALSNQVGTIHSLRYVWAGLLRGADKIEISMGSRTVAVEVLQVADNVRKDDAGAMYKEI